MIPAKIVKFLEQHANIGFAGLRDANLVPFGSRISGWQVGADGRTLTVFLPAFADRLADALLDNGQIAVTVEEFPMHETYQLKGRYRNHRPVRPDEIEIARRTRERFATSVRTLVTDEEPINQLRASIPEPTVAVEIDVLEVFVQTPGPGAGARISPPPDA
jgi:hypothetical protein